MLRGQAPGKEVVPGVIVVKLKPGTSLSDDFSRGNPLTVKDVALKSVRPLLPRRPGLQRIGVDTLQSLLARLYIATIDRDDDPQAAARAVARHNGVEYAEPKYVHHLETQPNDPLLPNQTTAFTRLQLFNAWSVTTSATDVVVAVVDGGTYWPHEDLVGNLWINTPEDLNANHMFDPGDVDGIDQDGNGFVDDVIGWNFANESNDPRGLSTTPLSHTHGTATASHCCAVTDNGIGMAGTAWNASLMPICAATPTGDNLIAYGYEGILYAAMEGASIINCSWGRLGGYSSFEQDVIGTVTAMGSLVVAAAGNTSTDLDTQPHYPSLYAGVLSVGATNTDNDLKASFSNYGANVNVFAPGVNIWSALTNGLYGLAGSGSSYSSSLVAGVAALVKSHNPDWTPDQIAAQIRVTSDPLDAVNPSLAGKLGRGRVNAARALAESHPAVDIVEASITTTSGSDILLVGDTVLASFRVRNVLPTGAGTISFFLSTPDPVVEVLQGSVIIPSLGPGEELLLPAFTLVVHPTPLSQSVRLLLSWTVSGEPSEAHVFLSNVFPSAPRWVLQESGTNVPLFSTKAVTADIVWAAGGGPGGTFPIVLRTTDGGETWEPTVGSLVGVTPYCIAAVDALRAWVGTGDGRILATADGGVTWNTQTYPDPQSAFINGVWFVDPLNGFAQGDPAPDSSRFVLLRTSDGGSTWTHVPDAPVGSPGEYGWNNSFWWNDTQHGWFGTNNNRVWRTSDGGITWSAAPTGAASSFGVAFADNQTGFAAHGDGTVAKTVDGGLTWSNGALSAGVTLVAAAASPDGAGVWVSSAVSPYWTDDLGAHWEAQSTYPIEGDIAHLSFASETRGWAVTSGGQILRYDAGSPTSVDRHAGAEIGVAATLSQNYPNPFNPTTTIQFTIPTESRVRMVLVDLLGRTVRTLLDENQQAGSHQVRFDARGLASGIYFYTLEVRPLGGGATLVRSRSMVFLQ